MGATQFAGHRTGGGTMERLRRNDTAAAARRREMAAWVCTGHPSLRPTIFAPSGWVPAGSGSLEVAARKV